MSDLTVLIKIGPSFTNAQKQIIRSLDLEKFVREAGLLVFDEISAAYQACSALLHVSLYEGFGFPALEAMASGIPAVLSASASLPEVAQGAALFVSPQRPDQMAEALYKLLSDPSLSRLLIIKGKEQAARFRWKDTAEKTLQVYKSL